MFLFFRSLSPSTYSYFHRRKASSLVQRVELFLLHPHLKPHFYGRKIEKEREREITRFFTLINRLTSGKGKQKGRCYAYIQSFFKTKFLLYSPFCACDKPVHPVKHTNEMLYSHLRQAYRLVRIGIFCTFAALVALYLLLKGEYLRLTYERMNTNTILFRHVSGDTDFFLPMCQRFQISIVRTLFRISNTLFSESSLNVAEKKSKELLLEQRRSCIFCPLFRFEIRFNK